SGRAVVRRRSRRKQAQEALVILAGDLGGTKFVLAECDDRGQIKKEQIFKCADYSSPFEIIDQFLGSDTVDAAAFGVAGPVVEGTAHITNLPWKIESSALSERLGGPVTLLNDLQATALGLAILPTDKFAVLQQAKVPAHATIAVIAPGTGLGEAMLVSDGKHYRALPSEAGHADFAPATDEEWQLLLFLRAKYGPHVSVERVLCGNGIGDLYDFCRSTSSTPEPQWLAHEMRSGDRNAAISNSAIAGNDPITKKTLSMFAAILGAEAGNQALRGLATGGVVIGGGIPPKILPALQTAALLERFTAKGRFTNWMKGVALRVSLEPRAALLGAAHSAVMTREHRA
ncbi:MAG TPA: glucokinase, partial [Kofleriaceae bacterium]|nr:glucokinase [Kofleriaceae bacterium]